MKIIIWILYPKLLLMIHFRVTGQSNYCVESQSHLFDRGVNKKGRNWSVSKLKLCLYRPLLKSDSADTIHEFEYEQGVPMARPLDLLSPVYWKSKRGQARWQDILVNPRENLSPSNLRTHSYVSFVELVQVHGPEGRTMVVFLSSCARSMPPQIIVSSTITNSFKYIFPLVKKRKKEKKKLLSLYYLFVIVPYYLQFDCSFVIPLLHQIVNRWIHIFPPESPFKEKEI